MSFNSIKQLLENLQQQPGWEEYQEYRRLLECWYSLVDEKVALHTRPLYLNRQILWVATSSAAWAQNLSLQRYSLLKKLNNIFSPQLLDIRFSSAKWQEKNTAQINNRRADVSQNEQIKTIASKEKNDTPKLALERWLEVMEKRRQNLPFCPQCDCPTNNRELERWGKCSHCMVKQWSQNNITNLD